MKDITGEILFVHADDSHIVRYSGTVDDNKVTAMEYEAPVALMESIWAPVASQIHDAIIEGGKA